MCTISSKIPDGNMHYLRHEEIFQRNLKIYELCISVSNDSDWQRD